MEIHDRTLVGRRPVYASSASYCPVKADSGEPNDSFQRGSLFKRVGRVLLTLLAIFVDIATE